MKTKNIEHINLIMGVIALAITILTFIGLIPKPVNMTFIQTYWYAIVISILWGGFVYAFMRVIDYKLSRHRDIIKQKILALYENEEYNLSLIEGRLSIIEDNLNKTSKATVQALKSLKANVLFIDENDSSNVESQKLNEHIKEKKTALKNKTELCTLQRLMARNL